MAGRVHCRLPSGTNITDALHWAERVRAQVAAKPIQVDQHAIEITLSIGVVELPGKDKHSAFDEAIRQADIALYQAKENGRNQVRCFGAVNLIAQSGANTFISSHHRNRMLLRKFVRRQHHCVVIH